jgi:FMN-dependent NADH-azoreductase
MAHLLHIDTSIRQEGSVSREVSGMFAEHWRAAHPRATYTYRDFGTQPVPHLDWDAYLADAVPVADRSPEQHAAAKISAELIADIVAADTVLLGVPMYNYTIPSSLKAWVDRVVSRATVADPATGRGPLSGRRVIVVTARGGAYGPGMPRESFEFQERYLRAIFAKIGLDGDLTFVNTELTLAAVSPALAAFIGKAEESRATAHHSVRTLAAVPVGSPA